MKKLLAIWALLQALVAFPVVAPIAAPTGIALATAAVVTADVFTPQAANAAEHNGDPTFANPSYLTLHTGWSYGTNKLIGSNVRAQRAERLDATIIKGHTYRYTIVVPTWSSGSIQLMLGAPKGSVTVPATPSPTLAGLPDIPDNFTSSAGVINVGDPGVDSSADPNGSFRFDGNQAKILADDPMVLPGLPGRSHLHCFYGNTGVNAYSTYKSLRQSGGTSLGNPNAPLNRTAYWHPCMLDGEGNVVVPMWVKFYYKQLPASNAACGFPDATHSGICTHLPNGLKWVWGFNMATMTGGPSGGMDPTTKNHMDWQCLHKDQTRYTYGGIDEWQTLKAMVDAVNAASGTCDIVHAEIEGPDCWNGTQLDTPNHHDHVSDEVANDVPVSWTTNGVAQGPGLWQRCPTTHPYMIPRFTALIYWKPNPAFFRGHWRLSSDEQMSMSMDAGTTLHFDYWEAWSPYAKNLWETLCIDQHKTCAAAELGDGTGMPESNFTDPDFVKNWTIPLTNFGFSRPWSGTGTFTGDITAVDSGEWALYSPDGFTGEVTSVSIQDITKNTAYSTPITMHGSIPGTLAVTTTTLNPADLSNVTLTNGNLTAQSANGGTTNSVRSILALGSGKYYWEAHIDTNGSDLMVGIGNATNSLTTFWYTNHTIAAMLWGDSLYYPGGTANTGLGSVVTGDYESFAYDGMTHQLWYARNCTWAGTSNPSTETAGYDVSGLVSPKVAMQGDDTASKVTFNFGASAYHCPVPTGFTSIH